MACGRTLGPRWPRAVGPATAVAPGWCLDVPVSIGHESCLSGGCFCRGLLVFWSCLRPVWVVSRSCFGDVSVMLRRCLGHVLVASRSCVGLRWFFGLCFGGVSSVAPLFVWQQYSAVGSYECQCVAMSQHLSCLVFFVCICFPLRLS